MFLANGCLDALPPGGRGGIVALGTLALLNTCAMHNTPGEPLAVCTGTPSVLKKRHTAKRGAGEHHRTLLLKSVRPTSQWVVEVVPR